LDESKIALLSSGFILALYFASNAMAGLMRSFNKNYIGFSKRKDLHNRWMAIKLTSLIFLLVLGLPDFIDHAGCRFKMDGYRK
jgi:membrane protein